MARSRHVRLLRNRRQVRHKASLDFPYSLQSVLASVGLDVRCSSGSEKSTEFLRSLSKRLPDLNLQDLLHDPSLLVSDDQLSN